MDVHYSKQAEKFLKKQDSVTRNRIRNAIHNLPAGDVKKLQGRNGYRLRIGDYRVIFDRSGNVLYIECINNRGQIYKEV
ncbi:MAG: type II toxin-antitoxin system RelE/ParE family toxin [Lachnospiraceae bacterium]|nr:type II toxin-antitoxin system RelE/ParE family toxin [Lachnospiraceae bacterium]